jgi:putative chitobiose transport system permease protein
LDCGLIPTNILSPIPYPLSPHMIRLRQINWTPYSPYLFLAPALLLLGMTVFLPAVQAFYLSFTDYDSIAGTATWQGLKNFERLLKDEVFWQTMRNTVVYLSGVVPVLVFVPLLLAIALNQKLRGMSFFRAAYYVPVIVSMVVAGIAWKFIYAENGLLDRLLQIVGIAGLPWLTSPSLALFSVMLVTIWKGLGYYMTIYLAGLQSIPADLYEAAAIDGSDRLTKHWDITIPLMRPYMLLVAVISAIAATKIFEEVYVMTKGGPRNSSKTVVYYLYQQGFGSNNPDLSYACTIGLVLFIIIFVLSIVNLKLSQPNGNIPK